VNFVSSKEIKQYLAKLGRKGGAATAKNRTPEQRKQIARKAAQARWAKEKRTR
jgi:general stress protein YciG